MDLFEHQAKELFAAHGVAVPRGRVAWTPEEAAAVAAELGGTVVVKAQVQTGGRGKAGGIKLARDPAEARGHAEAIIGMDIRGHTVRRVLVEEASEIAAEYYVAILHDRAGKGFLGMASAEGGVEIEEVAASRPEAIVRVPVNPLVGLRPYHVNQLVYGAGFDERARRPAGELLTRLYDVFVGADCMLVEVNPLVLTADGQVRALDGKVTLDDSSLYRHPDLEQLRDTFAVDPQEQVAKERGLNYIKLDGHVGIIGNGAGLVMSTLDVVAQAGGRAANFLDVGGGASAETMADGLEVILSDQKVRSVLVNIFGGITRGDLVARGILDALDRLGDKVQVPLVVRLDGTNAEEGRALLAESPSELVVPAATMLDAAAKAVELANAKAGA
ncbi:MAG TPA: ADP-forming succinate--CoA ligase subunit beta [Actinomycetes bacterium]|jgi:succinyl-CoA synthetase beta subunit|nr:ADP-forming succinate--CoA ligase subunit beta [Actinomycetes bacterium]